MRGKPLVRRAARAAVGLALALLALSTSGCDEPVIGACDRSQQLCNRPCFAADDCEDGHACTISDASVGPRLALIHPDEDGGAEEDAGYEPEEDAGVDPQEPLEPSDPDASVPTGQRPGYCARACRTELCASDQVCSSGTGFCMPGCDETHLTCGASELCDYQAKECRNRDGSCTADDVDTCFDIPSAFKELAERSCVSKQCRIDPKPMSAASFLDLGSFVVRFPRPGDRITNSESQPFRIKPPSPITVLAILTEQPETLSDLDEHARWIAYVGRSETEVSLAAGRAMVDGKWTDATPDLPQQQTLYFVALGYDRDELRSASVVPFSFGPLWQREDAECFDDGVRCDNDRDLLICVDDRCKRACLSDGDCAEGSCSPPLTQSRIRACL